MKKSRILTILMVLVLMFSLVACSTAKNNDKSQSNNTADISDLMESEPSNLDDATALYKKLMQKENEILSSNSQLFVDFVDSDVAVFGCLTNGEQHLTINGQVRCLLVLIHHRQ